MSRIRSIHFNACKSEKLQSASAEAERCYWRLLPHCDDEGRAEDDPRNLRSEMFPIAEPPLPADVVDGWLEELCKLELIVRYEINGKRYLQVTRWHDYQKPQHPKESLIPPPSLVLMTSPDESGDGVPVVVVVEGEVEVVGEVAVVVESPAATGSVETVFRSWQEITNHPKAVLDAKRRGFIKTALKSYSVEDLIDAFRGVALSPHHRGENEARMVYDSIELILRDANHIEKFRDLTRGNGHAPPPQLPRGSDMTQRNLARMMGGKT